MYFSQFTDVDATALWDPYDAPPPTFEIMGTTCIWSHPTFANWL